MAPKVPKLPVDSILIDLKAPEPMSYLDAYQNDVMRHEIGTGGLEPLHPDVCAGIYLHRGELVWKVFDWVAPAAPAQSAASYESLHGFYTFSSHAPASSWNAPWADLGQEVVAHSAFGAHVERPPPGPPSDYETDPAFFVPDTILNDHQRIPLLAIGRLAELPAPTGRPRRYSYSAKLVLFPHNSTFPVMVKAEGGSNKTVVYDLELDTGGLADSWVYAALRWESFRRLDRNARYPVERLKAAFARKMKMPFPGYDEVPADRSTLSYGTAGSSTTVRVKSGLCAIAFAHWDRSLRLENFPIGVAYAASDKEILSSFDGLLGLCRTPIGVANSRMNPEGHFGPCITLPEAARRQGLIKNRDFWIHISDPTWDEKPDQNFMCLGSYKNPFDKKRLPTWLDLDCDAADPDWKVTITKITVYDTNDTRRPRPNLLEQDFIATPMDAVVDSGCSQSFMPGPVVTAIEEMFKTQYNAPLGSASYACPKSVNICFHFVSGGQPRAIEGQAIRFFISPHYIDADHPALSVKQGEETILGLNFFRTFIIGFRDDDTNPKLTIGKHRSVSPDMAPRLACREPSDRTRDAGTSTRTQPTSGANREIADPRSAGEMGGRGNPRSGRLRKPSVSAPAKDAPSAGRGGNAPGHQRSMSDQVPFPRGYRGPLPGEDEGQGSSRQGANARAQQEATYGQRTGRRPSESYTPAAPQQFQQPANAGGAGRNVPPAQRTRGNSLSYGAPAQPAPVAQQPWTQPGTMYPAGGALLQRTTSQPLAVAAQPLAPTTAARRRPPALPVPVPSPVPPPRQPRPRTSSLTAGIKNILGFGKKSDKR